MPPALALEKSMESLLRVALAPCRFPAASRLVLPASNLQPLTSRTSNRYNKLLESPVTRTKQTIALRSNRYRFAIFAAPISPQNRRSRLAAGTVALALNLAATMRARAALIANEMRSPAHATNSQRATYDFLIANEFQLQNALFTRPARLPRTLRSRAQRIATRSASSNVPWRLK